MHSLTFQSKHPYSDTVAGIEVPISLSTENGRAVRLLAKIDTGPSFCIFQRDYAEQLGIDVESGTYVRVATASGSFDAYGHRLMLSCLEWQHEAMVYFAAPREVSRNVVGRAGWLEQFRLAIIHHDSTLYLSPYDD